MTNTRVFSGDMWTGDRGWSAHTRDDVVAMVRVPDVHTYSRVTHTHGHTRTRTHADKRTALKKRKIIKCLSFILRSSFATNEAKQASHFLPYGSHMLWGQRSFASVCQINSRRIRGKLPISSLAPPEYFQVHFFVVNLSSGCEES